MASAASFAIGAAPPLAVAAFAPVGILARTVAVTALLVLAALGAAGAEAGGAPLPVAVIRVTFWGALAMAVTALIGHLFGTVV
jgi:VIT1/CCC1 family predicted Fe2+/Mn2+ transporter